MKCGCFFDIIFIAGYRLCKLDQNKEDDMTVILCIDTEGGMMFNHRRVTYDRIVSQDILRVSAEGRLIISPYSEKLFKPYGDSYIISENPLVDAREDDFVFIEGEDISPYLPSIDSIIIYNWNLPYPYDVRFTVEPSKEGFLLSEAWDFPGNSHDIVTKSVYRRR